MSILHRGAYMAGFALIIFSCQNAEQVRLKQYQVQGRKLYLEHCSNCHQTEGQGLSKLYPPLAQSDYMLANMARTICIIKNGIAGEITVNGQKFHTPMPGTEGLSDLELAEITTYLFSTWGNLDKVIPREEVLDALERCVAY